LKEEIALNKPLYEFFEKDHRRLDALLDKATLNAGAPDPNSFAEFRAGLLRHIGLEEKILFPAAQKANGGKPLEIFARLRLDHGAITALLVPPPSRTIINALKAILVKHDNLEESAGGPYEACEALVGEGVAKILKRLRESPPVPVLPHKAEPFVLEATRRALIRAGYNLDDYSSDSE
jgi:hypothetical protein